MKNTKIELNEKEMEQVSGGSNVLEELKKKNEEMKEKYNSSIGTDFPEPDIIVGMKKSLK